MKPALQLRLSPQLTMTPQLQQAIRLLQLPVAELSAQLQQALADNVMLEQVEPAEQRPEPVDNVIASEDGAEPRPWSELPSGGGSWSGDDTRPEQPDNTHESLRDHLLWQLEMEHFSPREIPLGQAIVDAINESGYLTEPLDTILATIDPAADATLADLEATLVKIQALDPVGVGARDLAECIRLQLLQLDPAVPGRELALQIAARGLELVASQDYALLRRQLGAAEDDLAAALALVKACHPKPGLAVQPTTTEYIIPDVFVRRRDGRWVVDINRSIAPRLKVNQVYADLVRGDGDHLVLRNQLQEARWLVRSLEIRHETLMKVAMCIVERQTAFLEQGEEAMRPMVLRDVAEAVAMHESTISRVTANKYMHTPRGVFEFRHFFSSQVSGDDGSEQSSTAVRAKIRRLVGQEDPARPLSDSQLADLLAKEGIQVARRTVAKYRELMGIEPSSERKRRPGR